eukprot:1372109-Rhodomonas_salina.2
MRGAPLLSLACYALRQEKSFPRLWASSALVGLGLPQVLGWFCDSTMSCVQRSCVFTEDWGRKLEGDVNSGAAASAVGSLDGFVGRERWRKTQAVADTLFLTPHHLTSTWRSIQRGRGVQDSRRGGVRGDKDGVGVEVRWRESERGRRRGRRGAGDLRGNVKRRRMRGGEKEREGQGGRERARARAGRKRERLQEGERQRNVTD